MLSVFFVAVANRYLEIDYGFWGCMTPVFASLFDFRGVELPENMRMIDSIPMHVAAMTIALLVLSEGIQFYCLLALPLLLCYSGKRGKAPMKYFFYLFYPLHLVALTAIQIFLVLI